MNDLINTANIMKGCLEMAYDCFNQLTWQEKKDLFATEVIQNKIYEIPRIIEYLGKYLKKQDELNNAIDNSFEKPVQILKDSDGRETEVK